jgi:hypothetical protein
MSMLRLITEDDSAREMIPPEGDFYAQVPRSVTRIDRKELRNGDKLVMDAILGFTRPARPWTDATDIDLADAVGGRSRSSIQQALVRLEALGLIERRGGGRTRIIAVLTRCRTPRPPSMICPPEKTETTRLTVYGSGSHCPSERAPLSTPVEVTVYASGTPSREEREKTIPRAPSSSAMPVEGAPPTTARSEDKDPDPLATLDPGELAELVLWATGPYKPGLTLHAIGQLAKLGLAPLAPAPPAQPRRAEEQAPPAQAFHESSGSSQPVASLLERRLRSLNVTLPRAESDRPQRVENPAPGDSAKNPGAGRETPPSVGESVEHASGRGDQKDQSGGLSANVPPDRPDKQIPDTPIIR